MIMIPTRTSITHQIEWHHCEDAVEPDASWWQSYHALQKAYAEGDIMSIGVSNFDIDLLQELTFTVQMFPHLVQNYATVGHDDMEVRNWCKLNNVVYQPYASARDFTMIPAQYDAKLAELAIKYKTSKHVIIYKYFLQTGASVIPRSSKTEHLQQNLNALQFQLSSEEMVALGFNGFKTTTTTEA